MRDFEFVSEIAIFKELALQPTISAVVMHSADYYATWKNLGLGWACILTVELSIIVDSLSLSVMLNVFIPLQTFQKCAIFE